MAGLTTMPDAPMVARIFTVATGESPDDLRPLGQGVTASGWRVDARGGPYCVLIGIPREVQAAQGRDEPPQFGARHALLTALAEVTPLTPRAIATSVDPEQTDPTGGRWAWQVTSLIEGAPAADAAAITAEIARDLGGVLAALHALPVEGFGPLEDTVDAVRGVAPDRAGGIIGRWSPDIWPFDGRALLTHPVARLAPALLAPLSTMREPLLRYAEPPSAVAASHTDLKASHFLLHEGRLAGLIDFGDAAIVPPAFDIASFAYYQGWALTTALLEGYATNRILREIRQVEAHQLSVVLALQKIEKATRTADERRRQYALDFLAEALPLAAARRGDA
ncbi:MAG: aminoglycoside phosphotransferase family protein [Chloroflexi bacterium]|nr:aminoglycoside phosphotransferase family protein [Chloroflexota bacterium]